MMSSQEVFAPGKEDLGFLQGIGDSDIGEDTQSIDVFKITSEEGEEKHIIERKSILDFGDEGFLLKNLMTTQECQYYITEGEKIKFASISESRNDYRSALRIMNNSQALADVLWERLRPYLSDIVIGEDPHIQHIHGPAAILKGIWKPLRLNPLFRLCKYEPGGHFAPHFDGHFLVTSRERSLQTLMLYLNADFQAGTTNFVHEDQALYKDASGKYCAEEKNVLYRIRPEPGMAIVFNHHRLHEGEAVRNGTKYILRTDILFEKADGSASDPHTEQAFQLVQEAERLEAAGDNMAAMQLYRRAYKLSPGLEQAYG